MHSLLGTGKHSVDGTCLQTCLDTGSHTVVGVVVHDLLGTL